MVSCEHHYGIAPQIHFVQDIHNLLNAAFAVLDGVQVVVIKDGPHVLAICWNDPRPAVPALLVFRKRTRHTGCGKRFLEACWKSEGPFLFVDRGQRRWRCRFWRHWLLNRRLAGDIAIPELDVVRIDETRHHEEGLASSAGFGGGDAEPAHAFARDERIVVKAATGIAADVATCTEYVEAVGLSGRAVVDSRLGFKSRKRHPVKPATISGWRDALNAWLLPNLGEKLLADVSNKAVRELVEKMSEGGLAAKTIVNYVQVAKLVVASAVNDEGEQVYPRTWNHDFIQLPVVLKDKQHRPSVTDADLKEILSNTKKLKHLMLFSLLAATGLRIGEALALRATDFGPDCRVLHVRRSVWRGQEQEPKTSNAVRVVDVPEILAIKLREYLASTNGYLFATGKGHLLQHRNVLRILHAVKPVGFHAFRRFRLTWLRRNGVPKDLERYWMGHAPEEVGDLYSKLKDDVAFRQE